MAIVEQQRAIEIDKSKVVYQTMKSPKKGGQHVNTTCSGVRAIYEPLKIEVVSYDERSQHRNKQIALNRLIEKANTIEQEHQNNQKNERWKDAKQITRGSCLRVFKGVGFREIF